MPVNLPVGAQPFEVIADLLSKTFMRTNNTALSHQQQRNPERITKALARAGVGSRRQVEKLIQQHQIKIAGKPVLRPEVTVTANDLITVAGKIVKLNSPLRLFAFHKPKGAIVSRIDPKGRTTVFDLLPAKLANYKPVGRLDYNSEGLLLFSNDGELARILELPQHGFVRQYRVRAFGKINQRKLQQLANLAKGFRLQGKSYRPITVHCNRKNARLGSADRTGAGMKLAANYWFQVKLTEGKNREIREIFAALGLQVNVLIRTRYADYRITNLPCGHWQWVKVAQPLLQLMQQQHKKQQQQLQQLGQATA